MPRKHYKQLRRRKNLAWLWVTLGAVLLTVVGILVLNSQAAPSHQNAATQTAVSLEITPAEAYAKLQQGAFFLDVRSQEEWDQYHIKGSVLIPLDQLSARLGELPQDRDIVVVCLSGHRSQSGAALLVQAGFARVSCMNGGLQAWMEANYPVEKSSQ
jgi:rhodanese-related sulfurtransferase